MTEPEDTVSEEELAEAEALARALERGQGDAPDDALGAAALLRYSAERGDLNPARSDAILEDVLANARPRGTPRRAPWAWLVPALGLSALSAAAVLLMARPEGSGALPVPTASLLEAQAEAASGAAGGTAGLEKQMRAYRGSLYASLTDRYGR